jgi:hypothetical protein
MKTNMFKKVLGIALLSVAFVGCDSILEDVEPPTSVSFEAALTSPEAVRALRAEMYSSVRASFSYTTQYMVGPGAMADETRNRPGSTRFNDLNQANGTSGTTHLGSFGNSYTILRNANMIIGGVADGVLPAAELARYRGEALAIRAFVNHNMARTYGYEPGRTGMGGANWDLSIILRTDPTLDLADAEPKARATVAETYASILSDLTEARGLLSGTNTDVSFVTEAFVVGLAARVNLYAGNWSQAASLAQEAISLSGKSLQSTQADVGSMFFKRNPEAIFELVVNASTEAIAGSNINNGLAAYTADQWVPQVPTQTVIDKYDAGDYRLATWYIDCQVQQSTGAPATGCSTINSLSASINKWNGWKGNLADDITYMRVAEMYLIWAEAAAKAANSPAAGVAPLQTLRTARNAGVVPASALTDMMAFENFILDERMRELIVEGHRFFDLKRLGRDIPNVDGTIKIRADSYRMLAPFGTGLQNVNPLLVENPGYDTVN